MPGVVSMDRCYCNKCSETKPSTDFSTTAQAQHKAGDENAMCQSCVTSLYKGRLARNEISGYVREERERLLRKTRSADLESMQGDGRWGKSMHHSELILKLSKLIPNLEVRDGNIPGDISFYRIVNEQIDFICYSNSGQLPEYSIVRLNKDNQPVGEHRGWRTVLLRFIKSGLLTEEQADETFGRPTNGNEARFWRDQLFNHRNSRN